MIRANIRPDVRARFRCVMAKAIKRADSEHAAHLAAIRAEPMKRGRRTPWRARRASG